MRDQNEFMRQMLELVDLAKAQESRITKDQVRDFCSDLDLTAPQLKLVYDFLDEHNIEVAGHSSRKHGGKAASHTRQPASCDTGDRRRQHRGRRQDDISPNHGYARDV